MRCLRVVNVAFIVVALSATALAAPPPVVRVRAPAAPDSGPGRTPSIPDSIRARAPAAPDQQPNNPSKDGQKGPDKPKDPGEKDKHPGGGGKHPGGGNQIDPGHAGPQEKHPGGGKHPSGGGKHPGHGGGWGKGHFIPVPFPVPSGGHYEQWTNSESEVPLAPPAPSAPLVVANPEKNGVTMPFLLNGQNVELPAGKSLELPTDRAWEIKFDHGGGFGVARYSLTGGVYQFTHTGHGWELYNYAADASE
jgi:hypothetical protein